MQLPTTITGGEVEGRHRQGATGEGSCAYRCWQLTLAKLQLTTTSTMPMPAPIARHEKWAAANCTTW